MRLEEYPRLIELVAKFTISSLQVYMLICDLLPINHPLAAFCQN